VSKLTNKISSSCLTQRLPNQLLVQEGQVGTSSKNAHDNTAGTNENSNMQANGEMSKGCDCTEEQEFRNKNDL